MSNTISLLENATSDGPGSAESVRFSNEKGEIQFWGVFNGATVAVEFSPDNGTTWVPVRYGDVAGTSLTTTIPRALPIGVVYGQPLRAIISNSSEGTDITVRVYEIR